MNQSRREDNEKDATTDESDQVVATALAMPPQKRDCGECDKPADGDMKELRKLGSRVHPGTKTEEKAGNDQYEPGRCQKRSHC